MKRLFFAIPVPEERKAELLRPFHEKKIHGIRWLDNHGLHITLHFVGSTPDEKLDEINQQARMICSSASSFQLTFESFKTVFKNKKPVMIWAQFEPNKLFEDLTYKFREMGPSDEKRQPVPHITLARIKQLHRVPFELPRIKPFSFIADAVELWESHLRQDGSEYEKIKRWQLQ
jgi:2'-5' RNA ligase